MPTARSPDRPLRAGKTRQTVLLQSGSVTGRGEATRAGPRLYSLHLPPVLCNRGRRPESGEASSRFRNPGTPNKPVTFGAELITRLQNHPGCFVKTAASFKHSEFEKFHLGVPGLTPSDRNRSILPFHLSFKAYCSTGKAREEREPTAD